MAAIAMLPSGIDGDLAGNPYTDYQCLSARQQQRCHERPSRHHERRWRGGSSSSSRWPYNQKPGNDSASSSSVPRAVATTVAGTTIVVGATAATIPGTSTAALLPVRGHEACLLPCHGPCAASNQASSCCKGFAGAASNGHHHHHHPPTPSSPENNPHHRESHLILARKHLRETLRPARPTIRKIGVHQARAEDARNARKQNVKSDARGAFYHKVLLFFLLKFLSEATNNLALRF
ncbi:hypothetical protein DAPPUDRAFT_107860 [Daphnia pulex]|uniref:Uncharacterized protein n=1 Tax=Daphnia pulex TaxID=6669 RepID=E9GYG7_DAPPU|nr:hypothetical protein DAPPUDRAFT_107860 [Daphnia pulex]|eukprot:EFX75386.1 hypothetical protein DAPPUDRAFT_107860 [Daphnia pulex]